MGNCCARDHHHRLPSSLPNDPHESLWGEEADYSWSSSLDQTKSLLMMGDDDHRMEDKLYDSSSSEIKIRISRRELEELMGRVELQRLSVEQMVAHLISSRRVHVDNHFDHLHRISWRPALQSIPEVN